MSERTWYAVLDGAQDPAIRMLAERSRAHACLFSGKMDADLAEAAPWLVAIDEREPLIHEWRTRGAGAHWGLMCESDLPLDALRRHLRRFLRARLPDGMVVLFRFYDPRVFATYITAATPEERAPWFEGVRRFVVEAGEGVFRDFHLTGGRLHDGPQAIG